MSDLAEIRTHSRYYNCPCCKNEEDPLKNNGARVAKTFPHYKSMGIFPDAQGQLTLQFVIEPSRNSNLSEMLWLPLLFPRMKKIQSKMKLLEWPQHSPHYNSMEDIIAKLAVLK